jgi:1-deoxy-D-xylulose-5-phosphate synthase
VVFCVDRAGVVGEDGATHQGLYDIAMLRAIPNMTICQPESAEDFERLLNEALLRSGPTVIRYPRGAAPEKLSVRVSAPAEESGLSVWALGDSLEKANDVAARFGAEVVPVRYIKPFDFSRIDELRSKGVKIATIENGSVAGGFGEAIGADFRFGWPDEFIPHGSPSELEKRYGMDVPSIVSRLESYGFVKRKDEE